MLKLPVLKKKNPYSKWERVSTTKHKKHTCFLMNQTTVMPWSNNFQDDLTFASNRAVVLSENPRELFRPQPGASWVNSPTRHKQDPTAGHHFSPQTPAPLIWLQHISMDPLKEVSSQEPLEPGTLGLILPHDLPRLHTMGRNYSFIEKMSHMSIVMSAQPHSHNMTAKTTVGWQRAWDKQIHQKYIKVIPTWEAFQIYSVRKDPVHSRFYQICSELR